jgi:hypothetical protein
MFLQVRYDDGYRPKSATDAHAFETHVSVHTLLKLKVQFCLHFMSIDTQFISIVSSQR